MVYSNGDIDVRHPNGFVYEIAGDTLQDTDWVAHMREKSWVNITDFLCAYIFALMEIYYNKQNYGRDKKDVQSKVLSSAS